MLKKNRLEKLTSPVKRSSWLHASLPDKILLGDIFLKSTKLHFHEKQMFLMKRHWGDCLKRFKLQKLERKIAVHLVAGKISRSN